MPNFHPWFDTGNPNYSGQYSNPWLGQQVQPAVQPTTIPYNPPAYPAGPDYGYNDRVYDPSLDARQLGNSGRDINAPIFELNESLLHAPIPYYPTSSRVPNVTEAQNAGFNNILNQVQNLAPLTELGRAGVAGQIGGNTGNMVFGSTGRPALNSLLNQIQGGGVGGQVYSQTGLDAINAIQSRLQPVDSQRVADLTRAAVTPALDVLKDTILPGINDQAIAGGAQFGTGRQRAEDIVKSRFARDVLNTSAQISANERANQFNAANTVLNAGFAGDQSRANATGRALNFGLQGDQLTQSGLGLLPTIGSFSTIPGQLQVDVGNQQRAIQREFLQEPYQQFVDRANIATGLQSSQQINNQQQAEPNRFSQVLGGLLAAYGAFTGNPAAVAGGVSAYRGSNYPNV